MVDGAAAERRWFKVLETDIPQMSIFFRLNSLGRSFDADLKPKGFALEMEFDMLCGARVTSVQGSFLQR